MSKSFEKSIGIILLVLLAVVMFPMIRIFHMWGPHRMPWFMGPAELFLFLPVVLMGLLWILVAVWVYRDAESRGMSGVLWSLLVFFGNVVGLIIYMIVRSGNANGTVLSTRSTAAKACPSCAQPIQDEFMVCPHCGTTLQRKCEKCGKGLELEWKVCPYCGQAV